MARTPINETKIRLLRECYKLRLTATIAATVSGVSISTATKYYSTFKATNTPKRNIVEVIIALQETSYPTGKAA